MIEQIEKYDINALSHLRESNRLEAKLAKKSVPVSIWETYRVLPLFSLVG